MPTYHADNNPNRHRPIMIARLVSLILVLFPMAVALGQQSYSDRPFPELTGPYFGQQPPGTTPVAFAPGILNPPEGYHSSVVFSPDGSEAYWTSMGQKTFHSRLVDSHWSAPVLTSIDPEYGIGEAFFAPDGHRLYFLSRRPPTDGAAVRERIWYVERRGDGWSEPRVIDSVVARHPTHWQFSLAANNNLYFTSELEEGSGRRDLFMSVWDNARYTEPVPLGDAVTSDLRDFCPFIALDENYLIFSRSVPEENNRSDLFISFKDADGGWTDAVNMGDTINSLHNEVCPVVTPDGRYLFFLRVSGDINQVFWVSTQVIADMRPR